jgi:hypothetical protein
MDSAGRQNGPVVDPSSVRSGKVLLTAPIRAITISQPYASLIADGAKWVENRIWPVGYTGPLAIHAGKGTQYLSRRQQREQGYPTGAVIAIAELAGCIPCLPADADWMQSHGAKILNRFGISVDDFLAHPHTEGPWCWILRRVRKLVHPYPCRGSLGLWRWGRNGLLVDVLYRPDIISRPVEAALQEATS